MRKNNKFVVAFAGVLAVLGGCMSDQPEPGSDGSNDDASEISSSGAEPASESGEAALPTSEVTSQLALLSAAATPYRFWVVQHNIAGGTKNHGAASALTYDEQRIAAIASDQHHTPDLVTMEEVCVSQYVAFQKNHPTWHVTFTHMLTNQASCAEGSDHGQGQMIASPWPWTNRTVTFLGYPDNGGPSGSKHFGMLCVDLQVGTSAGTRVVHSCVVHLRAFHRTAAENEADGNSALSDAEVRERQTSTIRSTLRQVITSTGHAVVITGDFNALPETPVLTNMYAPTVAGAGDFYEADQTDSRWQNGAPCGTADSCRSGEYTMDGGRKFDYAFYSSNRARDRVSGAPMDKGASDHRLYQAFADLSL